MVVRTLSKDVTKDSVEFFVNCRDSDNGMLTDGEHSYGSNEKNELRKKSSKHHYT